MKPPYNKRKWSTEEISEIVTSNGYIFSKEYMSGRNRKIIIQDKNGYWYDTFFSGFCDNGLSIVGKNNPFSLENISLWLKLNNRDIILDDNNTYIDSLKNKLCFICLICGGKFSMNWANISQGQGCSNCTKSKGEKQLKFILEKNNISFISQKWFKDCRDINPLPFDFYLPDYNLCIEFHGRQHYRLREDDLFGGRKAFESRKNRDKIKENYCKKNKINLLIIPYNKIKNMEEILIMKING